MKISSYETKEFIIKKIQGDGVYYNVCEDKNYYYIPDFKNCFINCVRKDFSEIKKFFYRKKKFNITYKNFKFYSPHDIFYHSKNNIFLISEMNKSRILVIKNNTLEKIIKFNKLKPSSISLIDKNYYFSFYKSNEDYRVYNTNFELINNYKNFKLSNPHYFKKFKNQIFIVDSHNNRIIKITGKNRHYYLGGMKKAINGWKQKIIKNIKNLSRSFFNIPVDVNFDYSGNLYVSDCYNNRILKISPQGKVVRSFNDLISFVTNKKTKENNIFKLNNPYSFYFKKNKIVLADRKNNSIQILISKSSIF